MATVRLQLVANIVNLLTVQPSLSLRR